MNSVELFTGAGGLALGLDQAGFYHEAVIEFNQNACDTIRENQARNHPCVKQWKLIQQDVRQYDYRAIAGPVDLVAGGPPCQPFSLGGKHRAHLDSRDMFPQAARAIRELKPRAFIFENVKGLKRQSFASYFSYIMLMLSYPELTLNEGETWERHLSRLEKHHTKGDHGGLCYHAVSRVLNAADFGVPQKRERVFIVGFRSDVGRRWSFPSPTHTEDALLISQWVSGEYWDLHRVPTKLRPSFPSNMASRIDRLKSELPLGMERWQTIRDAIADLPKPTERDSTQFHNHRLVPGARVYAGHTGSPIDQPAKTLKAGVHGVPGGENVITFPDGSFRYFTVRESARLQHFPDDYVFHGSWTECMRQLGNAVPVGLAAFLARSVRDVLGKTEKVQQKAS
ncbi:MAG: DNA (cytosine-5-)-methyltransferase [FCB group bacterium]|jgi:DNA (cytosine-5)-methyltransferase 1|nr:DNA (cytosine-5-)-methyltransferase [FCB group bacterium]